MSLLMVTPDASLSLWERRLFRRAYAAHDCLGAGGGLEVDAATLDRAYTACAEITAHASRTFYLASGLLPPAKRWAARALYAFCRVSDDLVDRGADPLRGDLDHWRATTLAPHPPLDDLVALAWADTRARAGIPGCLVEQFFEGVDADRRQVRYATFDELAEYCYGVASTVGLMVMHIIGFDGPEAVPYAVKLGVALQLTNILRDVAEDWQAGRLYLPADELARFGLTEADVAAGRVDDRWRAFMGFQIGRNRRLYAEAAPGIPMLHADGRMAIQASADLYAAILHDIERHDADVFSRRAHVGAWGKLRRLPGIWWRARRGAAVAQPAGRQPETAAG